MMIAGLILFFLSVLLTALSVWKYSWLIVLCFFIGMVLLEVDRYMGSSFYDFSHIPPDLIIYSGFFYIINVHKIMNRRFFDFVKYGELKTFLEENDSFSGYNKFIYYFPIIVLTLLAFYIVVLYLIK